MIGKPDGANHQYDTEDFLAAVKARNFPAVSFLKAPAYEDGHSGYSDPLDEQRWLVTVINFLERQPEWKDTAVIVAYDDSDGWYDHQMGPIANQSTSKADGLTAPGQCGDGATALSGPATDHAQGRCGYGPRLPLLVISPFARRNFVDHSVTDQTSILRFIEDNWLKGERVGGGSFDAIANALNPMFDLPIPMRSRTSWMKRLARFSNSEESLRGSRQIGTPHVQGALPSAVGLLLPYLGRLPTVGHRLTLSISCGEYIRPLGIRQVS
jgi:phospholipase C